MTEPLPESLYIVTPTDWGEYGLVAAGGGIPPAFRPAPDSARVEALSQRDLRWKTTALGFSNYTIGAQGCALTCAAMIARMVDETLFPPQLQELLKPAGGFWQANLNWAAVPRVVPGLIFEGITNWEGVPADVENVKAHLAEHPLILWVDFTPGGAQQTHFVLATAYLPDYDDVLIADPWDGYSGRLLLRYGGPGWTLARALYGMRPLYAVAPTRALAASYVALATPTTQAFDDYPDKYTGGVRG